MERFDYVTASAALLGVPYCFAYNELIKGKPDELQKSVVWIIVVVLLGADIAASVFVLPLMRHR